MNKKKLPEQPEQKAEVNKQPKQRWTPPVLTELGIDQTEQLPPPDQPEQS